MYEAYKKPNLVHTFEKTPELSMEFRFPTSEDEVLMERYLEEGHSVLEATIYQLALTVVNTNILTAEGAPIVAEQDPIAMKLIILARMPLGMIQEMSKALQEYYPAWKLTE